MHGYECDTYTIVSQLIWREFFYCMSTNNPFYGEMARNPICIDVPWYTNDKHLAMFEEAKTGYPFIDAGVRQLRTEGWIHHVLRWEGGQDDDGEEVGQGDDYIIL